LANYLAQTGSSLSKIDVPKQDKKN